MTPQPPAGEDAELIDRLRATSSRAFGNPWETCLQAADRIAALTAELADRRQPTNGHPVRLTACQSASILRPCSAHGCGLDRRLAGVPDAWRKRDAWMGLGPPTPEPRAWSVEITSMGAAEKRNPRSMPAAGVSNQTVDEERYG